ncbi:hypothetical protein [Aquabacterium sp.]|uniref:hypothetical protein n=1 Tax=Aquabacterium sp. TaxID=1872578 RepID=UPI002CAA7C17|nr:hypothetical protein [Aquabacterium sp.]HSW05292.1 hypothetical protein [Aquabacterium sp.]
MTTRYVKTEVGRQAIRDRAQALSRPARNLLLIIDGQKPGADWVGLVNGSTLADLQQLIDGAMVEPVRSASSASSAPAPAAAAPAPAPAPEPVPASVPAEAAVPVAEAAPVVRPDETAPLRVRLAVVGYRHLYDTMTAQARPLLGLIKGYRMVLDVEKCNGPDELRSLAARFIDEVRAAQGAGAAYRITETLCAGA